MGKSAESGASHRVTERIAFPKGKAMAAPLQTRIFNFQWAHSPPGQ